MPFGKLAKVVKNSCTYAEDRKAAGATDVAWACKSSLEEIFETFDIATECIADTLG